MSRINWNYPSSAKFNLAFECKFLHYLSEDHLDVWTRPYILGRSKYGVAI